MIGEKVMNVYQNTPPSSLFFEFNNELKRAGVAMVEVPNKDPLGFVDLNRFDMVLRRLAMIEHTVDMALFYEKLNSGILSSCKRIDRFKIFSTLAEFLLGQFDELNTGLESIEALRCHIKQEKTKLILMRFRVKGKFEIEDFVNASIFCEIIYLYFCALEDCSAPSLYENIKI